MPSLAISIEEKWIDIFVNKDFALSAVKSKSKILIYVNWIALI